jgi:hypothetical protein
MIITPIHPSTNQHNKSTNRQHFVHLFIVFTFIDLFIDGSFDIFGSVWIWRILL